MVEVIRNLINKILPTLIDFNPTDTKITISEIIEDMISYLAPQIDMVNFIGSMLSGIEVVGGMGCGKTTFVKSLMAKILSRLYVRGIDEQQILYLHSYSMPIDIVMQKILEQIDIKQVKYIFFVNDDAPSSKGQNARKSMGSANIRSSQYYFTIRHKLEDAGFSGNYTIAHLTQRHTALDKNLKVSTKLKIFKDYPEELDDRIAVREYIGNNGEYQLKLINNMIFNPHSISEKVQGLESGIIKFLTYPAITMRITKTEPKQILEVLQQDIEEKPIYVTTEQPVKPMPIFIPEVSKPEPPPITPIITQPITEELTQIENNLHYATCYKCKVTFRVKTKHPSGLPKRCPNPNCQTKLRND